MQHPGLFCHEHEPLLFSGSDDGEVKIWRVDNNTVHANIHVRAERSRAFLLAADLFFSPPPVPLLFCSPVVVRASRGWLNRRTPAACWR